MALSPPNRWMVAGAHGASILNAIVNAEEACSGGKGIAPIQRKHDI